MFRINSVTSLEPTPARATIIAIVENKFTLTVMLKHNIEVSISWLLNLRLNLQIINSTAYE